MKLASLSLTNVQCFEDARLKFSDGLNVVIGRNNVGKSALFRSIVSFHKSHEGRQIVRKHAGAAAINLHWLAENSSEAFDPEGFGWFEEVKPGPRHFEAFWTGGAVEKRSKFPPDLKSLVYVESTRRGSLNERAHSAQVDELAAANGVWEHLPGIVAASAAKTEARAIQADIALWQEKILGLVVEPLKFGDGELPGIAVEKSENDPRAPVFIHEMGAGVQQLVLLIHLFCRRSNNVFLIEEPENDLHPAAQRELSELMRESAKRRNNQFVVSTHSNVVLRTLTADVGSKVFEVTRVAGAIPTSRVEELTDPAKRIASLSELGYRFEDLGLPGVFLILEEASMQVVMEGLVNKFFPNLVGRIRFVSSMGAGNVLKRVSALHELFLYAHLSPAYTSRSWVLVDGDPAGQECIEKLRAKFAQSSGQFVCLKRANLEAYYPPQYAEEVAVIGRMNDHNKSGPAKRKLADRVLEGNDDNTLRDLFVEQIELLGSIESVLAQPAPC